VLAGCTCDEGETGCDPQHRCGVAGKYQVCWVNEGCGTNAPAKTYNITLRVDSDAGADTGPPDEITCQDFGSCQQRLDEWCAAH